MYTEKAEKKRQSRVTSRVVAKQVLCYRIYTEAFRRQIPKVPAVKAFEKQLSMCYYV
jgi:hypothetical protein